MSATLNQAVECEWSLPNDHPVFLGHFPAQPIVPGVMLLERALKLLEKSSGHSMLGKQITSVKFISPVQPDEVVKFQVQHLSASTHQINAYVASRLVAKFSISIRTILKDDVCKSECTHHAN